MFELPAGIGQVHAMNELFKADPRVAILKCNKKVRQN